LYLNNFLQIVAKMIGFVISNSNRTTTKTHNESVKFEFMETIPSSLEPETSARACGGLEVPADAAATDDADVNIHSLTRPSTPHVT
jgi:hypothetical protein